MNYNQIYQAMKRLIEKRAYATKEEALEKIDIFYARNRLSTEEYEDLLVLVEQYYGEN